MFGYIAGNKEIMTEEQATRYKACYCGLCRALRTRCGSLSRMTLTYDMTFLILLLSSLYEPEEQSGSERCVVHPMKTHSYWSNEITDYAADMNLTLAYLSLLDDWKDERKVLKRAEAGVLKGQYLRVKARHPEKCARIEGCLDELAEIERRKDPDPDAGARCFGRLMAEVFNYREDPVWGAQIRAFGNCLGEFIYILDAVADLEKDRQTGSYNAMAVLAQSRSEEELLHILKMLIGDCAAVFEKLPLVQDIDILRNILYSGISSAIEGCRKEKEGVGADE